MTGLRAYQGDPRAPRLVEGLTREEVITTYTPKVRLLASMVHAKVGRQVEFEDLLHAGVVGLLDAIDKYDASRCNRFSTYAEFRIRGAILDSLRGLDLLTRTAREKANRLRKTISDLQVSLGREPSHDEIARGMDLDLDGYFQVLDEVKGITLFSMDDRGGDPDSRPLSDTLSEPEAVSVFDHMADADMRAVMKDAIKKLPERLRQVILLYYFQGLKLKEIGEVLSLSESRVCQLHSEAILRLRSRAQREMDEPSP